MTQHVLLEEAQHHNTVAGQALQQQLFTLANQHFSINATVIDCGVEPLPSRYDELEERTSHALFDYSDCPPSDDQQDINDWLATQPTNGSAILHMGAGNSSVAKLCPDAHSILAVTVAPKEKQYGDSLALSNYQVFYENKHSESFEAFIADRKFDYILDNNLASFVCCQKHFLRYISALVASLNDGGVLVTHWLGMQWVLDLGLVDTETCWLLDEPKLSHLAECFDLSLSRNEQLFFLRKRSAKPSTEHGQR